MNKLFYILIFFALTFSLSAQTKSKDMLIFKIGKSAGSPQNYSFVTFYFYQSGRIDCQKYQSVRMAKKLRTKKAKCLQTSPAKISELIKIAEESDFRQAEESYNFFEGGIDWGSSLSIIYFSRNGQKEIELDHSKFGEKLEPIPSALKKFLEKIGEINKTLKVEYEL